MTREEFEQRVARLERVARENPARYRLSVLGWTVFGTVLAWCVPIALVGVCVAAVVGVFYIGTFTIVLLKLLKFGVLPALVLAGGLVKVLAGRLDPPEGMVATREAYPELFAMLDRVAAKAGLAPPREVRLDDDFNAGVAELPRVPLLPLYRTYLQIGLPLMASLTPEELEAVLAHELGHVAGAHGRLSARIYRVRRVWGELAERIQGPAGWFLGWYAPRYNAQTFVMAREDEYFADAFSASTTSARIAGDALVRCAIESSVQAEEFWRPLFARAHKEPAPPSGVMNSLFEGAAKLGDPAQRERALQSALKEESSVLDTHPALSKRLEALGVEPRVPPPVERSAAQVLLGAKLQFVGESMGSKWRADVDAMWTRTFRETQKAQERIAKLEGAAERTAREELELGTLSERVGRTGTALMAFQRAIEKEPQLAEAHLRLGALLLEEGETDGVRLLDTARNLDPELDLPATSEIYRHYLAVGDDESAERERERLDRAYDEHVRIETERSELHPRDQIVPAGLEPTVREPLAKAILLAGARGAWIARKLTTHGNRTPVLVIVVDPEVWGEEEMADANAHESFQRICRAIDLDMPWLAFSARDEPEIKQRIAAVPDSRLV